MEKVESGDSPTCLKPFSLIDLYSSVFNSFLNAPGSLFTEFISQENINEAQWTSNMWSRLYLENIWFWNQFIYNKESVSGITYNDESLLVLRATNGCSLTMTYDYISKSVTGFGIDPNFLTSGDSTLFYDTDLTSQLNFENYSDEIFSYGGCPPPEILQLFCSLRGTFLRLFRYS